MRCEWTTKKISEIANFSTGKLNSNAAVDNGKYPFFTCAPEPLKIDTYNFDEKAIILAGNNAEGNFHISFYEGKFNAYQRTYIITSKRENVVDTKYLYYALKLCLAEFKVISQGTTTKFLTARILSNFEIILPAIYIQNKIAAILSALDEKIAINREINDNLEQQAASLYFSMFVSYDYYANMEFEDSEFGRIPKGWQVLSLDDVTINIRDRVHNNNYRVLSALNSGILQPSDEYFTKQVFSKDISNYIIVAENDFAYNPARVNIGSLGINDLGYTGCVSPVYVVFRTENNYQNFMRFFVKSKRFQEEVQTRASGSVRQAMNYADFSLIRLVYPPKSAIDEFNDMVEPIWKNIKHLRQENEKLSELRDSLLPKLMSGEIDVSAVQL